MNTLKVYLNTIQWIILVICLISNPSRTAADWGEQPVFPPRWICHVESIEYLTGGSAGGFLGFSEKKYSILGCTEGTVQILPFLYTGDRKATITFYDCINRHGVSGRQQAITFEEGSTPQCKEFWEPESN